MVVGGHSGTQSASCPSLPLFVLRWLLSTTLLFTKYSFIVQNLILSYLSLSLVLFLFFGRGPVTLPARLVAHMQTGRLESYRSACPQELWGVTVACTRSRRDGFVQTPMRVTMIMEYEGSRYQSMESSSAVAFLRTVGVSLVRPSMQHYRPLPAPSVNDGK